MVLKNQWIEDSIPSQSLPPGFLNSLHDANDRHKWSYDVSQQHCRISGTWPCIIHRSYHYQYQAYCNDVHFAHSGIFRKKTSRSFWQPYTGHNRHLFGFFVHPWRMESIRKHNILSSNSLCDSLRSFTRPSYLAVHSLNSPRKGGSPRNYDDLARCKYKHNSNSSYNLSKWWKSLSCFLHLRSDYSSILPAQQKMDGRDKRKNHAWDH